MKTVIVGGVAGGASAAARLRRLDESAEIVMFERGQHVSYANCGLPYYVGGVIKDRQRLLLQTPDTLRTSLNIDARVGQEVLSIDRERRTVTVRRLSTGEIYEESYDYLLLSPGGDAIVPPIVGLEQVPHFTLRTVIDADKLREFILKKHPSRAVVLGAGFIGVEMAENLVQQGIQVSLVEMGPQVLPALDGDMASLVHGELRRHGVELLLGRRASVVQIQGQSIVLGLDDGTNSPLDLLILAAGIRPNSQLAAAAGLRVGERGTIVVDESMRTSDQRIFAVGDAVQVLERTRAVWRHIPLAGPANKQGRLVADVIAGKAVSYPGAMTTSILKVFDLTVAATGMNETEAKGQGLAARAVVIHPLSHAGYYPGGLPLTLKLVFDVDGKVLGAQGVGFAGVDKRIDVVSTVLHFGGSVRDLASLDLAYAPPFSSAKDPVNMLGFIAENVLQGDCPQISVSEWMHTDLTNYTVLDVREQVEWDLDRITGAMHIPLGQLRERLPKIPTQRPILVYCQVGLRGYLATRILQQKGHDVRNLSGGLKLLRAVEDDLRVQTVENGKQVPGPDTRGAGETATREASKVSEVEKVVIDACGLQCPGPIMQVYQQIERMQEGQLLEVTATDPAFQKDVDSWCRVTGNTLVSIVGEAGKYQAIIRKGGSRSIGEAAATRADGKTMVVFSGDLDKAIAAFIIANGAAAMGKPVTMFFTFWGLNILRRPEKVSVQKGLLDKMFGMMMPRGSRRLGLSKMNMLGIGPKMIRHVMGKKQVFALEDLILHAKRAGVRMVACQMSMDVMGIKPQELVDGIEIGGVATFLDSAERSNMSLFI